jgi:hypothetical protein
MDRIFKRPFLWPEPYRSPAELSIPFLLDEKSTVVPVRLAGEQSGGKRKQGGAGVRLASESVRKMIDGRVNFPSSKTGSRKPVVSDSIGNDITMKLHCERSFPSSGLGFLPHTLNSR